MIKLRHTGMLMTMVLGLTMNTTQANPSLTPGTWVNLTPSSGGDVSGSYWCNDVQFAPTNHNVLFACMTNVGPSKSTDGGATWTVIHGNSTINSPQRIRIDPDNINHLYTICGVGGNTGFFVTTDGGANWSTPAGYDSVGAIIHDFDMYYIDVDPTDFNHILLSYHYYWYGGMDAGVVESFDGGKHCIIHPIPGVSNGGYNVFFLYNPKLGIGDSHTWLYATQGSVGSPATSQGFWRTTNSGATWDQVTSNWMTHGGTQIYYAATGVLYAAWEEGVQHSTDNGKTWQAVSNGLSSRYYFPVQGDGKYLYTIRGGGTYRSLESDGLTWSSYVNQTFSDATMLAWDSANSIMYAAGRAQGVWALKIPGTSGIKNGLASKTEQLSPSGKAAVLTVAGDRGVLVRNPAAHTGTVDLYDVGGRRVGFMAAPSYPVASRFLRPR